ncbi:MAG: ROK family protein [Solirubrobacterales bacterium]|nr:ROK family protein [Solirubrobacterales bacterium]
MEGALVGVDVGGTKVAAAVVDGVEIVASVQRPTELAGAAELLDAIAEQAREAARRAGVTIGAVGVGVPSQVDAATGTALASVNVPFEGVPVRAELGMRLGVPIFVDNDANCAALAESRLAGPEPVADLTMLTLGTGVGGGVIAGGRIFRGATGLASELGHMVVDGARAPAEQGDAFPRPGSLEWHCSGRGLERAASEAAAGAAGGELARVLAERGRVSGRDAVAAARAGDAAALAVLARYARWLGIGIATVVNMLEPSRVAIGGGLSEAADLFLDAAVAEAALWALPALWERTEVALARGGPEAGAIGAALLAAHELPRNRDTAG